MLNHEITSIAGKHKSRTRIGRGPGTGHGKTSGRGHKGAGSRAGSGGRGLSEGGQMPLFRRLPKRGFSNLDFAKTYQIVNVSQLDIFSDGDTVDVEQLAKAGLIDNTKAKVKVLGDGELTKKLQVVVNKFSKTAQDKIVGSGGTAKVVA